MEKQPTEILRDGRRILDPVLGAHGFSFADGPSGKSSGGPFAGGAYVNGDRNLEIHYRYSLGLVTYHFAGMSVDHDSYMRAVLGNAGGNKYPCFSEDSMDAFRGLAHDLESFAQAFLEGNTAEFARCVAAANDWKKQSGLSRLTHYES